MVYFLFYGFLICFIQDTEAKKLHRMFQEEDLIQTLE